MEKSPRQRLFEQTNNNLAGELMQASNEMIEKALAVYAKARDRDSDNYVKETLRVRMCQGAQLVVPYTESRDGKSVDFKMLNIKDGGELLLAYTGFDGLPLYSRGITKSIKKLLEMILLSNAGGILLNPGSSESEMRSGKGYFISREDALWLIKAYYDPERRSDVILYPEAAKEHKEYMKIPALGDKNSAAELLKQLCVKMLDNAKINHRHSNVIVSSFFKAEDLTEAESAAAVSEAAADWLRNNVYEAIHVTFLCENKTVYEEYLTRLGEKEPFQIKG